MAVWIAIKNQINAQKYYKVLCMLFVWIINSCLYFSVFFTFCTLSLNWDKPHIYSYPTYSNSWICVTHQMHDLPLVFQTPPADWCFLLWVPLPSKWAGRSPTVRKTSWAIVFSTSCSMEVTEPCEEHSIYLFSSSSLWKRTSILLH